MSDITLHVYCTTKIRAKLEELAKVNHRSMSAEVQYLVEQAYRTQIECVDGKTPAKLNKE